MSPFIVIWDPYFHLKFCSNSFCECGNILPDKGNFDVLVAQDEVRGLLKPLGFILWTPRPYDPNFTTIWANISRDISLRTEKLDWLTKEKDVLFLVFSPCRISFDGPPALNFQNWWRAQLTVIAHFSHSCGVYHCYGKAYVALVVITFNYFPTGTVANLTPCLTFYFSWLQQISRFFIVRGYQWPAVCV